MIQQTVPNGVCGSPTDLGPCTMKAGHSALYHRHIPYSTLEWSIRDEKTNAVIIEGTGKVDLQYAMTKAFEQATQLLIRVKHVNSNN